ncbi:unnamed protein product [Prorocentrum cordatum]|uniref:Uncharacterized protein n=1 Tax=Prorocentrum cordatum TaxID=2364126 RepID=A0ABN9T0Y0_9DINO|nr:unnamed protein product [Polarella glacialis]
MTSLLSMPGAQPLCVRGSESILLKVQGQFRRIVRPPSLLRGLRRASGTEALAPPQPMPPVPPWPASNVRSKKIKQQKPQCKKYGGKKLIAKGRHRDKKKQKYQQKGKPVRKRRKRASGMKGSLTTVVAERPPAPPPPGMFVTPSVTSRDPYSKVLAEAVKPRVPPPPVPTRIKVVMMPPPPPPPRLPTPPPRRS